MKRLLAIVALSCAFAQGQTVQPVLQPHQTFVDSAGFPCTGCKLYSYLAGTTTASPTYTDSTGVTANTNPVVLDVAGGANIWTAAHSYKFVLKAIDGSTIWTVDNVNPSAGFTGYLPTTGGTLTGALTGTSAAFSSFSGTTGSLSSAGVFTNTQMNMPFINNINSMDINGVQSGLYLSDAIVGAIHVPASATVYQADGLSGFIQTDSATTNAVGMYTQARAGVNNAKVWGTNPVFADYNAAGTIFSNVTGYVEELDYNAFSPTTAGAVIFVQGNLSGLTSGSNVGVLNIPKPAAGKWNYGINLADQSLFPLAPALTIGATALTSADSFHFIFRSYNSGGSPLLSAFYTDPTGMFRIQGNAGTVIDGGQLLSKAGTSTASASAGDMILYNGTYLRSDTTAHNATYRLIGSAAGTSTVSIDPGGQGATTGGPLSTTGVLTAPSLNIGVNPVIPATVTGFHGTSGTKVQLSDNTGTTGHVPLFAADGSLTDSGTTPANRVIAGYCQGTATASATLSLGGLGGSLANCTTGTAVGAGAVMPTAATIAGLYVRCGTTGVNASSGLFTVYDQPAGSAVASATPITITYGTTAANTLVSDTGHATAVSAGDLITVKFTTQIAETLANCSASITY